MKLNDALDKLNLKLKNRFDAEIHTKKGTMTFDYGFILKKYHHIITTTL